TANTTINLRPEPSVQQPGIGRILAGALLNVLGRSADKKWWNVISTDNGMSVQGWVSADYVTPDSGCTDAVVPVVQNSGNRTQTPSPNATAQANAGTDTVCTIVTKAGVNLRADPSLAHDPIAAIPAKTTLNPTERSVDGQWWQVTYNSKSGWVAVSGVT